MSVEQLNNAATDTAAGVIANDAAISEDAELEALFDQVQRDNGAARDDGGKFASADGGEDEEVSLEGEDKGEAGDEDAAGSTLAAPAAVPLPANWNGMDADWAKIPPDVQAKIAARDTDIHKRMTDQGRQITAFQPIAAVVARNKDLLAGKTLPDGKPFTAPLAVEALLNAQRRLEANPVAGIIDIAERFGITKQLFAVLTGQAPIPADRQPASPSAADVERIVKDALSETAQVAAVNEELNRLSKDKPLYSEIAEDDMVHSIHKARARLGEAASKEAIFDLAYDIAIHADPDLRAKAANLKKAAAKDPKRTDDARRANAVNVTSNSSGKTRQLTEDEQLARAYDAAQSKG